MGLDMYFTVRKPNTDGDVLMCMNGGFPIGFQSEGKQIGYLRKAYSVHEFLLDILEVNHEDINCVDLELKDIHLNAIKGELEFRFDENYFSDDWEEDDWRQLQAIMKIVEKLRKEPDTKFYYTAWY